MRSATATLLDLSALPEQARREVNDFYQFMAKKYVKQKKSSSRNQRLQWIFDESHGVLPDGYRFNRDEAHER